jgi:hypothetical protein
LLHGNCPRPWLCFTGNLLANLIEAAFQRIGRGDAKSVRSSGERQHRYSTTKTNVLAIDDLS